MNLKEFVVELLKVSEKAANLARIIRSEQALFELLVEEKTDNESNKRFVRDFKTLADVLIQECVKQHIGLKFKGLAEHITGEETNKFTNTLGETVVVEIQETELATAALLSRVLNDDDTASALLARAIHQDISTPSDENVEGRDLESIHLADDSVGIWIDPIDATYQYIEGGEGTVSDSGVVSDGLRCVTVLIGAYDLQTGRPIFGCVNQPFSTQDPVSRRWTGQCWWGVSLGELNYISFLPQASSQHRKTSVALSSSEDQQIKEVLNRQYDVLYAAGAGYKLLCVARQLTDLYVISKGYTYKWDTCAVHAILLALGGGIVSLRAALNIASQCSSEDLAGRLDKCQLQYHVPDSQCVSEPDKVWANCGGLIAYGNQEKLVEFINNIKSVV